jgi:endothelin-converting enzyme
LRRDILYQDPLYTYNKVPLSNITETITQVNFSDYFATFTPRNFPTEVIVTYPAYTRSLTSILNQTESDVLEAYLVTRAALVLAPRLGTSTASWKAVRYLQEVLQGIKPGAVGDRSEYCANSVDQALGFATGRYFVNETFAGDSKEKGTKVITGT